MTVPKSIETRVLTDKVHHYSLALLLKKPLTLLLLFPMIFFGTAIPPYSYNFVILVLLAQ